MALIGMAHRKCNASGVNVILVKLTHSLNWLRYRAAKQKSNSDLMTSLLRHLTKKKATIYFPFKICHRTYYLINTI